jgi:hypothetical protein
MSDGKRPDTALQYVFDFVEKDVVAGKGVIFTNY